jgi:glutamyl-tRNA synthetase
VYRGRLAPSPTGLLHLGHARTFWTAQERAKTAGGALILRNDDLDRARCAPEFVSAMFADLKWFGFTWNEGPDLGGAHGPYSQSERQTLYLSVFERLRSVGAIYPCACSRRDVRNALSAPHLGEEEPRYAGTCRQRSPERERVGMNWRFKVPDGEALTFVDGNAGQQTAVAGEDFGDFLVWRKDDVPSYQLACAADDAAMEITEVVRGADLILSTFRQLLLFRALNEQAPAFFHSALLTDAEGRRLAKRDHATSLRTLREQGNSPADLRRSW